MRCALLFLALAFAAAAHALTPEDRLSSVFEAIEANRLDLALKRVEGLISDAAGRAKGNKRQTIKASDI